MALRSTPFRLSDGARHRLAERAERDGVSATALLERLIVEGVDALDPDLRKSGQMNTPKRSYAPCVNTVAISTLPVDGGFRST